MGHLLQMKHDEIGRFGELLDGLLDRLCIRARRESSDGTLGKLRTTQKKQGSEAMLRERYVCRGVTCFMTE